MVVELLLAMVFGFIVLRRLSIRFTTGGTTNDTRRRGFLPESSSVGGHVTS